MSKSKLNKTINEMFQYIEGLIYLMSQSKSWTEFKQYEYTIEHMFQAVENAAEVAGELDNFRQLDLYLYDKFVKVYCEMSDRLHTYDI